MGSRLRLDIMIALLGHPPVDPLDATPLPAVKISVEECWAQLLPQVWNVYHLNFRTNLKRFRSLLVEAGYNVAEVPPLNGQKALHWLPLPKHLLAAQALTCLDRVHFVRTYPDNPIHRKIRLLSGILQSQFQLEYSNCNSPYPYMGDWDYNRERDRQTGRR